MKCRRALGRSPPAKQRRYSSLPEFSTSVKSEPPTTESSSVRSIFTDSLSSDPKSEIFHLNTIKCNRFTLRRKSKSLESITVRKTSTSQPKNTIPNKRENKKFFNTRNKLKNFFYHIRTSSFWTSSRPVYFPSSRSSSQLSRLSQKREENKISELGQSSQSVKPYPPKSIKQNTKETSYSDSTNNPKTKPVDEKRTSERLSTEVKDTHKPKHLKPKPDVSFEKESYRLSTEYYEKVPKSTHYDVSYGINQRTIENSPKRRLPDLAYCVNVQNAQDSLNQQKRNNAEDKYDYSLTDIGPQRFRDRYIEELEQNSQSTSSYNYSRKVEQQSYSEHPKQNLSQEQKKEHSKNGAISHAKHSTESGKVPLLHSEIRRQQFQQKCFEQLPQHQSIGNSYEKKHFTEFDQTSPGFCRYEKPRRHQLEDKQLQKVTECIVEPNYSLCNTLEFDQVEPKKQNKQKHITPKRRQEQLLSKRNIQEKQQNQTQQVQYQQEERQRYVLDLRSNDLAIRSRTFLWRREFLHQIELDSPFELVDSETEELYQNFKRRYYTSNTPEPRQVYPDSLETNQHENLSLESINLSESSDGHHRTVHHMGRMGSLEDHERKVIIEFCHLLEKSKQLFNGLRELPQYGHKQWHSYFGRTFDVYTKLWKFQQQHRDVLDSKYGMKRWQIGEIASKIGQLYYHFYLRTSETAYLNEAFSFYYAIRGRSYYTKACKEDKCELMVKKLRYYARFIVVCLLLNKVKLVRELIKELDRQIVEYGNTYDPDDQIEWTVVVDEVKAFIQAEPVIAVIHPDNYPVILSHRLSTITIPPVERTSQMNLSLQEVLIVGSSLQQVKFSELTMDMFRMLQTLEREPTGEIQLMYDDSPRQRFNLTPSALNNKGYNLETAAPHSENPHKYLLFQPSPSEILVYLASGCNDLPPNGALLLYISADGQIVQSSKTPEDGYDIGGLITTSKNDGNKEKGSLAKNKEVQCLHPGDLYPFTRRPLFIVIDSDNSYVFQSIPRHFGQPLVVLMSPIELPSSLTVSNSERRQQGSLFTLFLHSPLTAFCHCCDIHTIPLVHWDRAQGYIDTFLAEASQILTRSRIDAMFLSFMSDDFLRLLILRFIFCEVVLRMHRVFRARTQRTRSSPPIPDDLLDHPALTHIVMDLASHLQVRGNFHDPSTAAGSAIHKE